MSDKREMTRWQWVKRGLITLGVFMLAVNATAGWARFLMGDEMREPWFMSLLRVPLAAVWFWWGIQRLIEDQHITVAKRVERERS